MSSFCLLSRVQALCGALACLVYEHGHRHVALHTGQLTIFVYDGNDGGAGFAERATGCPSCVQYTDELEFYAYGDGKV